MTKKQNKFFLIFWLIAAAAWSFGAIRHLVVSSDIVGALIFFVAAGTSSILAFKYYEGVTDKPDRRLALGVVGWSVIVLIWVWMSLRYFDKGDWVGGLLSIVVAITWGIFGGVSIKKYLKKKK
jgi:hypothetical protein